MSMNMNRSMILCFVALTAALASAVDLPVTCETNAAPSGAQALPTEAGDFSVELPRATGGATVKAADFGFSPANDANPETNSGVLTVRRSSAVFVYGKGVS